MKSRALFHLVLIFTLLFGCQVSFAQNNPLDQQVVVSKKKYRIKELLNDVIPSYGLTVSYHDNIVPLKKVINLNLRKDYTIEELLQKICSNEDLDYQLVKSHVFLKYYDRPDKEFNYTISGFVEDSNSGEPLLGSTIYIDNLKTGVATNAYGFYSFTLPRGVYRLDFSFLGYKPTSESIDLNKSVKLNKRLDQEDIQLEDVIVSEIDPIESIAHNILLSSNRIDMEMANNIPYLGEVDVFQGSLLLPGITNAGEGVTGINVRSSSSSQNLILLDEAPIYNSNHFFGLISVFNPDAVSDVEILKGDFPAKYGGRTSSVMHIRQKEGDQREFHLSGGLGLITSRLMVEGPAFNHKSNYLFSARSTFWDVFFRNSNNPEINGLRANFQDLNAKWTINASSKNNIYLSLYLGGDATKTSVGDLQKWGNNVASLRWNSIINRKHFMNLTSYYSRYRFRVFNEVELSNFVGQVSIHNYAAKMDWTSYINPKNIMEYGVSTIFYRIQPGHLEPGVNSNFNPLYLSDELGVESAAYISLESRLTSRLTTSLGIRASNFSNLGFKDTFIYQDGVAKSESSVIDVVSARSSNSSVYYWNVLPRFSMKLQLGENSSLKSGYSKSAQYIHQISNTVSPASSDIWKISDRYIKPVTMEQYSLGIYRQFKKWKMNVSSEVYFRKLSDVIDYKNGADLVFNDALERELLFGEEYIYGIEFFVKKSFGKIKGWAGYTYSKSVRKIDSFIEEERINNGAFFPSDYDRTHDIATTVMYDMNNRWSFSSSFTYYTGRPYSFPDSKYEIEEILVPNYSSRNSDRLSNYHRLDISATLRLGIDKVNKKFESNMVFSIYNVYARRNAQAYFFTQNEGSGNPEIQRLSVLGVPIPSITYNFKF